MAFSYQTHAVKRAEQAAKTRGQYEELKIAEASRIASESDKAARSAVKMKAGETVHGLLEKGLYRKTKNIMDQDYFKTATVGEGDTAVNLFSKGETSDIPGSALLLPDSPGVNPDAYRLLGEKLYNVNPKQTFNIAGYDTDISNRLFSGGPDATGTPMTTPSDMDINTLHQKIGEKYASSIAAGEAPLEFGDELASASIAEDAAKLVEGEVKLAQELGTWGKLGKSLGPIGSVLNIGQGAYGLMEGETVEEKALGAANLAAGTITGASALASAGIIGGVSTGVGFGAGAAGGATLAGVGVSNFWNPVGWGIGIGAGLYGIGKSTGLF
jgi:hypothetical protein